jgi:hypothetical protein
LVACPGQDSCVERYLRAVYRSMTAGLENQ